MRNECVPVGRRENVERVVSPCFKTTLWLRAPSTVAKLRKETVYMMSLRSIIINTAVSRTMYSKLEESPAVDKRIHVDPKYGFS